MATNQEVIRKGLFKVLFPYSNADHYTGDGTVQGVLDYLDSEGVVFPEYDDEERTKIARSNAIGMGLIDD